ncbi:hypothetical protein CBR_g56533 [Chara braunii]|uniref:Uncharacterized protein n=1 Tax=Chara braunii TaxID=69332 RepID=A0A388MDI4_CHABU|nr:hypothetical protein CBR_g56533 [Chara braunii]|eukprot:GBG92628.1 hypothetical protein CBR_g56533 [Chara braunii]
MQVDLQIWEECKAAMQQANEEKVPTVRVPKRRKHGVALCRHQLWEDGAKGGIDPMQVDQGDWMFVKTPIEESRGKRAMGGQEEQRKAEYTAAQSVALKTADQGERMDQGEQPAAPAEVRGLEDQGVAHDHRAEQEDSQFSMMYGIPREGLGRGGQARGADEEVLDDLDVAKNADFTTPGGGTIGRTEKSPPPTPCYQVKQEPADTMGMLGEGVGLEVNISGRAEEVGDNGGEGNNPPAPGGQNGSPQPCTLEEHLGADDQEGEEESAGVAKQLQSLRSGENAGKAQAQDGEGAQGRAEMDRAGLNPEEAMDAPLSALAVNARRETVTFNLSDILKAGEVYACPLVLWWSPDGVKLLMRGKTEVPVVKAFTLPQVPEVMDQVRKWLGTGYEVVELPHISASRLIRRTDSASDYAIMTFFLAATPIKSGRPRMRLRGARWVDFAEIQGPAAHPGDFHVIHEASLGILESIEGKLPQEERFDSPHFKEGKGLWDREG